MTSYSDLFRFKHFFSLIDEYDLHRGSADFFVTSYFRAHPQLGSTDRAYLSTRFFRYMRQKSLVDALVLQEKPLKSEKQMKLLELLEEDVDALLHKGSVLPSHIRFCCPQDLYDCLCHSFSKETHAILRANFFEAPLFLRVNPIKATRDEAKAALLSHGIEAQEVEGLEFALRLKKRANLFSLPLFQQGWFEVQDAGSQQVALLAEVGPKQKVLDFCSGAGGKSLAFAHRMEGSGQLYLHDIRATALLEAKKRLRRAGIQNVQFIHSDEEKKLTCLRGNCDWVFVDVPCSGTGTFRRNPDMKWRFTRSMLDRLVVEQRAIFEKACAFLKPQGRIVYATCSVLAEENQEQVTYFKQACSLELARPLVQSLPTESGMDGLFAAVFRRK